MSIVTACFLTRGARKMLVFRCEQLLVFGCLNRVVLRGVTRAKMVLQ